MYTALAYCKLLQLIDTVDCSIMPHSVNVWRWSPNKNIEIVAVTFVVH